jgi:hypothetical protein
MKPKSKRAASWALTRNAQLHDSNHDNEKRSAPAADAWLELFGGV